MATFRVLSVAVGVMVAGWAALACSDDEAASSPSGDAGTNDDAGSEGDSGNTPNGVACEGPAATRVGLFGPKALGLRQTADALFVWDVGAGDPSPGAGTTGAIMKLPKAGGEPTVLYKPAVASHVVLDVLADGGDVYTAEFDNADGTTTEGALLRIPAAGGVPTTVASLPADSDAFGNLVAVDDQSIFFMMNESLYRAPRTGGAPVAIASLGVDAVVAQIAGTDLIVSQKLSGSSVWRVPRNASTPAEAALLTDESNCLGDLLAVPGGYYCASALSVTKLDPNFALGQMVYSLLDSGDPGALPRFAGLDGNRVLFGAKASANEPGPFRSFEVDGTTSEVIACGIGSWLEAAVDPTAVYLLQQQAGTDAPTEVVKFTR